MPRESIALTPAAIDEFLSRVEWVALGTLDAKGAPFADAAPAAAEAGRLYFCVAEKSRSEANLERDARCCCSADIFPTYYEIKGVTVHGAAMREASPPPAIAERLAASAKRNGLANGPVYSLPIASDAFGFDFGKIKRRLE